jgi:hypothetical protein
MAIAQALALVEPSGSYIAPFKIVTVSVRKYLSIQIRIDLDYLTVLKHFLVKKMGQSQSRQRNYVDSLKMARTCASSGFIPF